MAKTDRRQKVEELLINFGHLKHGVAKRSGGSSKDMRITPAQWGALMYIENCGGCGVKDVADSLEVSPSAATQLVDGLVKARLVVRKSRADDRRAVSLALTDATGIRVRKMRKGFVEDFLKAFESLSDKEFNTYCALTRKLAHKPI